MPSSLLALPAEIKIEILSWLPAVDAVRTRKVCRQLRDLIDSPENHGLLFTPIEDRAYHRVQRSFDRNINVDKGAGILQALKQFIAHRGIRTDHILSDTFAYHYVPLAMQWMYGFQRPHERFEGEWSKLHPGIIDVMALIFHLTHMHIKDHMPGYRPVRDVPLLTKDQFVTIHNALWSRAVATGIATVHQFDAEELGSAYSAVRNTPRGVLRGVVHRGDDYHPAMPNFPITELLHPLDSDGRMHVGEERRKIQRMRGSCERSEVMALFPHLPGLPDGPYFAYCVRSEWAYDRVKAAVAGNEMNRAEKAAVLEELFVY